MGPRGSLNSSGKNSRTQLVVLGGVSIVAASIVIRMLASGPQSAPAASVMPSSANTSAAMLAKPAAVEAKVAPVSVTWPVGVARDPFHSDVVFPPVVPALPVKTQVAAPAVPPAPQPVNLHTLVREKLQLKATVLGDRPLAMMNGRVFRVGEVVEGFRVVEIGTNEIIVERDGLRLVVVVQ